MFSSLESFSIFFFVSLALIILGVVFEEKLINFEERVIKYVKTNKVTKSNRTNCR